MTNSPAPPQQPSAAIVQTTTPALALTTSVQSLSGPVAAFLAHHALPTENVLNPIEERKTVIDAFENAISVLPNDEREKAFYLSKFVVAISVGIFDAALNYLWDETILALRRLVQQTDLAYFFDVAEKSPHRRNRLSTAEDLPRIDDAVLIETCVRIGLLHQVNGARLLHINYMRNHASAAHPNVAELNGGEMIGWLSNCLRYAITAKPDPAVVDMHQFLSTVRERTIDAKDVAIHEQSFRKMQPQQRVDDLLWTLFGLYTDPNLAVQARVNIDLISPSLWPLTSERLKYGIGVRHAEFVRRSDVPRRDLAMTFLKKVGGEQYRTSEILAADLIEKLRGLRAAHVGLNNFYNEAPHAASLEESVPPNGVVPKAVLYEWVSIISQCYIGNGYGRMGGVDTGAVPYYEKFVKLFGDREIVELLRAMTDPVFVTDLDKPQAQVRLNQLAKMLRLQAQDVYVQQGLDAIIKTHGSGYQTLGAASAYKTMLGNLPNFPS